MGLDLCFNESAARKAGLSITIEDNGDYGIDHILHIPNTDIRTHCEIHEGSVMVRANKWGRMYEPITNFLRDADITWSEY